MYVITIDVLLSHGGQRKPMQITVENVSDCTDVSDYNIGALKGASEDAGSWTNARSDIWIPTKTIQFSAQSSVRNLKLAASDIQALAGVSRMQKRSIEVRMSFSARRLNRVLLMLRVHLPQPAPLPLAGRGWEP